MGKQDLDVLNLPYFNSSVYVCVQVRFQISRLAAKLSHPLLLLPARVNT
jgi:hypothetical protein